MFNKLFQKKAKNFKMYAFTNGFLKSITEVPDPVFSEKMMGDGIAIEPDINDGTIYAPCDGEVILVMGTNHAVGIKMENGIEVLLHLGLETCTLDGSDIEVFVKVGDKVSANQKIAKMNVQSLQKANINTISMMIITQAENFEILCNENGNVKYTDHCVELVRR